MEKVVEAEKIAAHKNAALLYEKVISRVCSGRAQNLPEKDANFYTTLSQVYFIF